jgi:hypothetical protein
MASLTDQLADMTRQRDDLARTVSAIEGLIRGHREMEKAATPQGTQCVVQENALTTPSVVGFDFSPWSLT